VHHSFIFGSENGNESIMLFGRSRSPLLRKVFASAPGGGASSTFFKTLFSELERRCIIVSFWDLKHGNESMMLFGRSRSLRLSNVFDTFIKLCYPRLREGAS